MRFRVAFGLAGAVGVMAACGAAVSPASPVALPNVSGTWDAIRADSQGPGKMRLVLSQVDGNVAGSVSFNFTGGPDECNTCHRQTTGTVTGTMSGSQLHFLMNFPFGDSLSATPMCEININGDSAVVPSGARDVTASYSGDDTCMGKFSNGAMTLTRTTSSVVPR